MEKSEKVLRDLFGAIQLTLSDDWQTYAAILLWVILLSLFAVVMCSLLLAVVKHLRIKWTLLLPAVRAAFAKLGEKRMNERRRVEKENLLISDRITDAMDDLLLEGKITKKRRREVWNALGRALKITDLLPRLKHPKALKAEIQQRRDTTDKTPIPFPDQKFSPSEKWRGLLSRKVA